MLILAWMALIALSYYAALKLLQSWDLLGFQLGEVGQSP